MSDCRDFERAVARRLAGEPRGGDATALARHGRDCARCAGLLAAHRELEELSGTIERWADEDLPLLRPRILDRGVEPRPSQARLGRPALPWAAWPATAALDFDVTTHVAIVEPATSQLVREVLAHALLHPSDTGSRLKALSYAGDVGDPRVRDALIFAMRRDDSLAVRLGALAVLAGLPDDPAIEAAVLETLRDDESVPMRLQALDYLAARRTDRDALRRAIGSANGAPEATLMARLASYEQG